MAEMPPCALIIAAKHHQKHARETSSAFSAEASSVCRLKCANKYSCTKQSIVAYEALNKMSISVALQ